eukprot:ANDGO_05187.mRNA.1 Frequenin-1
MGGCGSKSMTAGSDPVDRLLTDLACETRFTKAELHGLQAAFVELAPTQRMTSREFEKYLVSAGQNEFLASVAFQAFDRNSDGEIEFFEFVHALSAMTRGTRDEKLDFAFNLYDIDGDGHVSKDELLKIIGGLYQSEGGFSKDDNFLETVEQLVEKILREQDHDFDDALTKDEFLAAIMDDPTIVQILGLM